MCSEIFDVHLWYSLLAKGLFTSTANYPVSLIGSRSIFEVRDLNPCELTKFKPTSDLNHQR